MTAPPPVSTPVVRLDTDAIRERNDIACDYIEEISGGANPTSEGNLATGQALLDGRALLAALERARGLAVALEADSARLTDVLHRRNLHPDFEYATTTGQRKAWDVHPPEEDAGWERNTAEGRGGWERFDYHEEAYWRRPRPAEALEHGGTVTP